MERVRRIVDGVSARKVSPREADRLLREEHGISLGHAERITMSFDERRSHARHERKVKALALALLLVIALGGLSILATESPTGHAVEQTDKNASPTPHAPPDDDVIPARAFSDEERK